MLRIEDTDQERSQQVFQEKILSGLTWLGLTWDGDPVIQSTRQKRHEEIAFSLLKKGKAYKCYCTPEELQHMKDVAIKEGRPPVYNRQWRDAQTPPPEGKPFAIRLKTPLSGETVLQDMVQGTVTVQNDTLDDMILLRSDGTPTFMLAVVVDDHDMSVSHIIRGNDHLMNAFRQIHIYQALEWEIPIMAHIPLIHGEDGAKLSKRHGAVDLDVYREEGILPEALRNTLLRLGWSHGDEEKISTAQALQWFDFEGLGRHSACFDPQKLLALNAYYLRQLSPKDILALPFIQERITLPHDTSHALSILPHLQQRAKTLVELAEDLTVYLTPMLPFPMPPEVMEKISPAVHLLQKFFAHFSSYDEAQWTAKDLEPALRQWAQEENISFGTIASPLRMLLTGRSVSPGVFEVLEALGKEWSLHRVHNVLLP